MTNNRLSRLLKSKTYENMTLEQLIQEYIAIYSANKKHAFDELLDELLILINRYDGTISRFALEEMALSAVAAMGSNAPKTQTLLPLIYEKSSTEGANLKLVFGATDERAIMALEDKLLWVGKNSNERISDKLHEIFSDVYEGKYTHIELMDKLREEFAEYRDIELHKLEAAADFTLRQGRNLGRTARAIQMGDKYLQVVAKIDDRTTNICRSMHLRVIKVSDIKEQYENLTTARTINQSKEASDLSLSSKGLWTSKLPSNFGIPPYHFGCRTFLRQMSELHIMSMTLDEFGREYAVRDKDIYNKIKNKADHLKGSRFKDVNILLKDTMENILKEGAHNNEADKRVILGSNGFLVFLDKNGKVLTCYTPRNKSPLSLFNSVTNEVYYDKHKQLETLMQRVKKWLGL